jgi:hypothetical protein
VERHAEGEAVDGEEALVGGVAAEAEEDAVADVAGEEAGLDADGDLEVDGAEAGGEHVDVAAGLADAVHEVGELGALSRGDGVGVDGVGGDKAGLPAAGPAEAGAGALDPLEALGDVAVVDGGDGAERDGAELLGGELADLGERLGVDAVDHGERVGHAEVRDEGNGLDRDVEVAGDGVFKMDDGVGGDVGEGTRAGAVCAMEQGAVGGRGAEAVGAEADGVAGAGGVVEVDEVLVDGGALEADDAAPGAVLEGDVGQRVACRASARLAWQVIPPRAWLGGGRDSYSWISAGSLDCRRLHLVAGSGNAGSTATHALLDPCGLWWGRAVPHDDPDRDDGPHDRDHEPKLGSEWRHLRVGGVE